MVDDKKKGLIIKMIIAKRGKDDMGKGGPGMVDKGKKGTEMSPDYMPKVNEYDMDDPTKAAANLDSGMPHKHFGGKGGPGYMSKKGKGGPGDGTSASNPAPLPIPGLDTPDSGLTQDPTMGGTITPAGSTPITPNNPSGTPAQGTPPSLPQTIASLPRLRSGVGKTLTPSRFSTVRSSARLGEKSPGAKKAAMTKSSQKESLKGAVRKSAGMAGRSPAPMSSMAKLPSFK